MYDMVHGW